MKYFNFIKTAKQKMQSTFLYALPAIVCFLSSCEPKVEVPEPSSGTADFSRYVAIGSSYSSGFADGALSRQGQLASFPNLLAGQMRLAGGAGTFNIPLLKGGRGVYPGDEYGPGTFNLTEPKFILVKKADCKGEVNILPERLPGYGDDELNLDDDAQRIYTPGAAYHHLGIPAMKIIHFTAGGYGYEQNFGNPIGFSPYFWRMAPEPLNLSSAYSYIKVSITDNSPVNPTFFTFELGMSDVLDYAINGGIGRVNSNYDEDITMENSFRDNLIFILDELLSLGAKGVIANIPDVTRFPFFTTIEYDALDLSAGKADTMNAMYASNPLVGAIFHEGEHNPFVVREDNVVRTIQPDEFVLLSVDVDSLKCMNLGAYIPIADEFILSEDEIQNVIIFTQKFNHIISEEAAKRNLPVVDLAGFMERIYKEITIEGIDLSAELGSGGFFSLDGLHPNDRGHALIANEFIRVINREYGARLPLLNITEFRGVLFP